jgi:hypothetical protein
MEVDRARRLRARNGETDAVAARVRSQTVVAAAADAAAADAALVSRAQRAVAARPVGITVVGAKRLPLVGQGADGRGAAAAAAGWSLEDWQASDVFVVVTALPQPLPPHALVGHGDRSDDRKADRALPPYARRQSSLFPGSSKAAAAAAAAQEPLGSASAQLAAAFSSPATALLRDADAPKVTRRPLCHADFRPSRGIAFLCCLLSKLYVCASFTCFSFTPPSPLAPCPLS